jgi:hypothetical protein
MGYMSYIRRWSLPIHGTCTCTTCFMLSPLLLHNDCDCFSLRHITGPMSFTHTLSIASIAQAFLDFTIGFSQSTTSPTRCGMENLRRCLVSRPQMKKLHTHSNSHNKTCASCLRCLSLCCGQGAAVWIVLQQRTTLPFLSWEYLRANMAKWLYLCVAWTVH